MSIGLLLPVRALEAWNSHADDRDGCDREHALDANGSFLIFVKLRDELRMVGYLIHIRPAFTLWTIFGN